MHEKFRLKSVDELREAIGRLNVAIPLCDDIEPLRRPLDVAGRTVPNRLAAQPMEGCDGTADGAPGPLTERRYRRFAQGGFGLIWFEATAVVPEGRANPRQLMLHAGNVGAFAELAAMMRREARARFGWEPLLILQLTHSGRYSKPDGQRRPLLAQHNPILDSALHLAPDHPLLEDAYLDALQSRYVESARLAAAAGFDGVDIKSCHRYLVSELLASFERLGRYGGPFENRSRLLREIVAGIRADVPEVFVTARINAFDAIPYPFGFGAARAERLVPDLTEPKELAVELGRQGCPILNVTAGNPYLNAHFGRPYDTPIRGVPVPDEHPLTGVARLLGLARGIQAAVSDVPVISTGYSWLRQFMPQVAAGVVRDGWAAMAGIGRGAFAYPDTPRDLFETGRMDPRRCCIACSACSQIMRDGGRAGCVVRDAEIYGPELRCGREGK